MVKRAPKPEDEGGSNQRALEEQTVHRFRLVRMVTTREETLGVVDIGADPEQSTRATMNLR